MKVISIFKNPIQLVKYAAANDRKAQQALYKAYAPKMLAVCRGYISDIHHAEEVMMNGFLKVFSSMNDFENKGSFEGWIRKIMVREAISFLRVSKNTFNVSEFNESFDKEIDEVNNKLNAEAIQYCIDLLPAGYKAVFLLYAIEGYKHGEIANMLGVSEGTSKSQLSKARKFLQEQLKNKDHERSI